MKIIVFLGLLLSMEVGVWGLWPAGANSAVSSLEDSKDGQSVQIEDFKRVVLAEMRRRYGRPHHQLSIRVLFPNQGMDFPKGKLHLEVGEWSGGGRTGRRAFRVGVFVNQQFIKMVNVVAEVKAQAKVATPVRWLKPKDLVTVEDLAEVTVDVPSLTHDFILNMTEVVGKQVLRPLPPRQPIRKTMLDHPPLIHKGDRVMIEVRNGGLLVQTIGIAKTAGKAGETISVKNQTSGRDVVGTVMSAGLVEVGFESQRIRGELRGVGVVYPRDTGCVDKLHSY